MSTRFSAGFLPLLLALLGTPLLAADSPSPPQPAPTYADLADLADAAPLVIRAKVRKLIAVEPARAQAVRSGWARFYVEAQTESLIAGTGALGQQLRYLADLPLDAKGHAPKLKKTSVVLFARRVAGRPDELQLVAPDAQLVWDPALEVRVRALLAELYAPDAPPRIAAVREAIHVAGSLAGEGESQLFLTTAQGDPAAITVSRGPDHPPRWSVSFSELVASDDAPARDTLAWYRLACFLPAALPQTAAVAGSAADRAAAARDYAFVIEQLGPCARTRNR